MCQAASISSVHRPHPKPRRARRLRDLLRDRNQQLVFQQRDIAPVDVLTGQARKHVNADPVIGQHIPRIDAVEIDQPVAQVRGLVRIRSVHSGRQRPTKTSS